MQVVWDSLSHARSAASECVAILNIGDKSSPKIESGDEKNPVSKGAKYECQSIGNHLLGAIPKTRFVSFVWWWNIQFSSVILSAFIVTVLGNSSVKLEKSGDERKTLSDMINNYYAAGAHCKRIELQLAEMKQEIKALREKLTGSPGRKGV